MSFSISGTGSSLPREIVTNQRLGSFLDTSDEWIKSRTGIQERHVCTEETLRDLSVNAAIDALADAGIEAAQLDLIICSTITPDHFVPSLSCEVQKAIGALCPAFDINAACSGFLYALDIAEGYFKKKKDSKILIISADAMSKLVDWRDRSICVLFADGAGAVVLTQGNDLKAIKLTAKGDDQVIAANGPQGNSPFAVMEPYDPFVRMSGQEVYRFAVSSSVRDLANVLEMSNLQEGDIDIVLLHQANARILEAVSARMKIPQDKFPSNIAHCGNTSSASIPILLDELNRAGKLKPGMMLAMSAFGGGLTTGACILRWQGTNLSNHQ
ncbi:MAG: ketoacyl-ACP synthase III [Clostridiales bacterium]|nr:ketoacyl-ACP synthase III [Clostridiales bacterium]